MSLSNIDPDENVVVDTCSSTATTTPGGSLSFSPVLRPLRNADMIDEDLGGVSGVSRSISKGTLLSSAACNTPATPVRNICCVGAGYVGMWTVFLVTSLYVARCAAAQFTVTSPDA